MMQMFLNGGSWGDAQVISEDWVTLSTAKHVNLDYEWADLDGYGFQWWVWEDTDPASPFSGAYTYIGQYGQYLTVLPKMDMVVAHQVYAGWYEPDESVTWEEYVGILERLVAAKTTP